MSATMQDIAEKCGVSIATVSRVLSGRNPSVAMSEPTRQRVLRAAKELGYRRNRLAAALATGRTQTIGIVSEIPVDSFCSQLISGVQAVCDRNDYSLVFSYARHGATKDLLASASLLAERCMDATIIATKIQMDEAGYALERLSLLGKPTVLVDQLFDDPNSSSVVTDDSAGARRLVEHLIGLGHRRIGFASRTGSYTVNQRLLGYGTALALAEIEWDGSLITDGDFTEQSGARCVDQLLSLEDPPTAVFAATDVIAVGILRRLRELGIGVPGEVSVAGFADMMWVDLLGLTTVRQPAFELGVAATELAIRLIKDPEYVSRRIVLPVELVERQTTGPPPQSKRRRAFPR